MPEIVGLATLDSEHAVRIVSKPRIITDLETEEQKIYGSAGRNCMSVAPVSIKLDVLKDIVTLSKIKPAVSEGITLQIRKMRLKNC